MPSATIVYYFMCVHAATNLCPCPAWLEGLVFSIKYNFIQRVWFPGCLLFRGHFCIESGLWESGSCPLSGIKKRLLLEGCVSITTMAFSIRSTDFVHCSEVVHFLEGPLWEVRL